MAGHAIEAELEAIGQLGEQRERVQAYKSCVQRIVQAMDTDAIQAFVRHSAACPCCNLSAAACVPSLLTPRGGSHRSCG